MKQFHLVASMKAMPLRKYRAEIKRYLILLLIPVLVLALLYVNVNQVVTQQAREYAELVANHFYVQSSSMLHEMQLVANAILRSSDMDRLLAADANSSEDFFEFCDTMRGSLTESPYVQHVYLVCSKTGAIYSDQGLFSSSSLPAILNKIGADVSELDSASAEGDFHVLNEDRLSPYCIFPVFDGDGNPAGTLIVTLRMMEFLRIFYSLGADLCTVFNQDVYISSYIQNINMDAFDWYNEADVSRLVGTPVACVYLEQEDYTYLVAIAKTAYNRPLHVILKWFFIYAFAALGLGYFYLYQISKQRYRHISDLVQALPAAYTGSQSYEHIYENIRKSLEDYRTQRESLQAEHQEHYLHALLTTTAEQTVTADQFQTAGIDPHANCYYVTTFFASGLHDPAPEKEHQHETAEILHLLFRSTIREVAAQYQIRCAFFAGYKIGTAIFFGDDAASLRETIVKLSSNVTEIMTGSYAMQMQVTISSPVSSVLQLPEAYEETHRLRSFAKSVNSSAAMISQEDLQHSSGVLLNGDFIRQEQILINTILVRKYEAVPSMVEAILSSHVSPLRKNYTLAQSRLSSIASVLAEGIRMASIPGFPEEKSANAIGKADSVRQLTEITRQLYGCMAEQSRESTSETDTVAIACRYIEQNLSDSNLNVSAICEAAGVSVQRLTRMFQSQFNMAIAEYMNVCRIKLAKELLPDKQLTVAQIAQQVGYNNTDTFTRNFRKVEGITASEYRKTLQES